MQVGDDGPLKAINKYDRRSAAAVRVRGAVVSGEIK